MPIPIILDTNIWVSYFIGRSFDQIALTVLNNHLTVYSCIELEEELENVLNRKKIKKLLHLDTARYLTFVYNITQTVQIDRVFKGCPDKKDDFLFDLAIQTQAEFLVTGDKRLLTFNESPVKLMSLSTFKETYPIKGKHAKKR